MHHDPQHQDSKNPGESAPVNWTFWLVLCGFTAFAALLLIGEHRNHLLGVLPFLILLACPFLHLFMHRGHGGHTGNGFDKDGRP